MNFCKITTLLSFSYLLSAEIKENDYIINLLDDKFHKFGIINFFEFNRSKMSREER